MKNYAKYVLGMKARLWASLLIFISAYSPLLVILCIRDLDFTGWHLAHPKTVYWLFGIAVFSVILTWIVLRSLKGGTPIRVKSATSRATDLMSYALPYIASFVAFDLGSGKDMASLGFFLSIMFILAVRTNCIFINPVMACFGYLLFDVEYDDHGVTKTSDMLIKGYPKKDENFQVERLATNLLLVTSAYGSGNSPRPEVGPEEAEGNQLQRCSSILVDHPSPSPG